MQRINNPLRQNPLTKKRSVKKKRKQRETNGKASTQRMSNTNTVPYLTGALFHFGQSRQPLVRGLENNGKYVKTLGLMGNTAATQQIATTSNCGSSCKSSKIVQ